MAHFHEALDALDGRQLDVAIERHMVLFKELDHTRPELRIHDVRYKHFLANLGNIHHAAPAPADGAGSRQTVSLSAHKRRSDQARFSRVVGHHSQIELVVSSAPGMSRENTRSTLIFTFG